MENTPPDHHYVLFDQLKTTLSGDVVRVFGESIYFYIDHTSHVAVIGPGVQLQKMFLTLDKFNAAN